MTLLSSDVINASLDPAVAVALLGIPVSLLLLWLSRVADRRDRKRTLFADAFAAVVAYWEYPYVIRRRDIGNPAGERLRISDDFKNVQIAIAFHEAWIAAESKSVTDAYAVLVSTTRQVMGRQATEAWSDAAATSDEDMNIGDKVSRDGLTKSREVYMSAVRDHLSMWPAWSCRAARVVVVKVTTSRP